MANGQLPDSHCFRLYEDGRLVSGKQHDTLEDAIAEAGGAERIYPGFCGTRWGLGGHDVSYMVRLEPRPVPWHKRLASGAARIVSTLAGCS